MKEYFIDMDVTFSARMYITAENEETAIIAMNFAHALVEKYKKEERK